MRRRDLILTAAAASFSPLAVRASSDPVLIAGLSPDPTEFIPEYLITPLHDVLRAQGWEEGRNYTFVARSTEGRNERLADAARALVALGPKVLMAFGDAAIRAAQEATVSIPIAALADDMVGGGHVANMARPGGNTTGVSILAGELDAKRLELVHQLVPAVTRVGALADTTTPWTRRRVEDAARHLGVELDFAAVRTDEQAFAEIRRMSAAGVGALNLCSSAALYAARAPIFELVEELRLPTIYIAPEAAKEGGLIAYGAPLSACYRQLVGLVVKIIKGAAPADLPVEQPTKLALAINLKTAKAVGLTVPPSLLAQADEIIE